MENLDFWDENFQKNQPMRILVSPNQLDVVNNFLQTNQINFKILIENVNE